MERGKKLISQFVVHPPTKPCRTPMGTLYVLGKEKYRYVVPMHAHKT